MPVATRVPHDRSGTVVERIPGDEAADRAIRSERVAGHTIGSGIGSIFKAPIGGAILSAEILYKRDFEADALFPSFIASVVGFSIYGAWSGWTPVFGLGGHFTFDHPINLVAYLILGVCAGGIGLLYPKTAS